MELGCRARKKIRTRLPPHRYSATNFWRKISLNCDMYRYSELQILIWTHNNAVQTMYEEATVANNQCCWYPAGGHADEMVGHQTPHSCFVQDTRSYSWPVSKTKLISLYLAYCETSCTYCLLVTLINNSTMASENSTQDLKVAVIGCGEFTQTKQTEQPPF